MTTSIARGYHGRMLDVDLTSGRIDVRALDPELAEHYLGGRGLATRMFFDEVDPACDPLAPDNVVVIATAPLLGTNAPTSCRGHMVFKSPLTGAIGSSNCGGTWAPMFKSAGYDVLIIRGRASEPVMLDLRPDEAIIRPAGHLWGLDVHQTTDQLTGESRELKRSRVLCIGPAGENLVRFAAVMNDRDRAYGRGGPGAVFGSKNLKAVRVWGDIKLDQSDPERYRAGLDQARHLIKAVPVANRLLRDLGTAGLMRLINLIEMLPSRNFQTNVHPDDELEQVSGSALRNTILVRAGACGKCPLACQRHTQVGQEKGEGPEYETLALLGPNCAVYDLPAVTLANYRCNELGLDTISCGATIACAMELFEAGAIPADLADGLALRFGSASVLPELVSRIAHRQGIGDYLAEGALRLSARFNRPDLAMTVKGMEIPAYDPRASFTQALGYMTSPTGACHLRGGYAVSLAFFGGAKEIPRFSILQSPIAIRNVQNVGIIQDSLGICRFTGFAFGAEPWARMVSGVTGLDLSTARLEEAADRIATLERLFNLAAGFTDCDDTLPARFSREPITVDGEESVVSEEVMDRMRTDYYRVQRWDDHGRPTSELLRDLQITSTSR